MLFSATQTTKVQDLARISLRPGPVHVDVDKEETTSTVTTLSQGYVVCPSDFCCCLHSSRRISRKRSSCFSQVVIV